ncbi:MAG: helix-turn-helix transcriptional regulator [Bacteroidetes bacterium]|nr:helix-turn-helix transcriptional regulator [Bacteroidota bacterium]
MTTPQKFNSISELHRALGFPKPLHPLISLVNYADIHIPFEDLPKALLLNFYKISYKKRLTGKIKYGQHYYDFDEGGLSFIAPNQLVSAADPELERTDENPEQITAPKTTDQKPEANADLYSGYTLLIHPDFIRPYPLATKIKTYGFFSYSANEALYLSDKEKQTIFTVFENIKEELNSNIDDFSQDLMISQIEVLLNYSNRFYKRQFITRKAASHDLLTKMEQLLTAYFENPDNQHLPTVEHLAAQLHLSPRYLSDMLRSLTGQNAQQHIHEKLIEKAKEYLTATDLSVAEIAYHLGFEHPQSFNKLFKRKTNQTPLEYKQSLQ